MHFNWLKKCFQSVFKLSVLCVFHGNLKLYITLEFEVVSTENFVGASDVVPVYYIMYIKPF